MTLCQCGKEADNYTNSCTPCYKRAWYHKNKQRILGIRKSYYAEKTEAVKERVTNYKLANRGRYNALNAKRKAKIKKATPAWADLQKISQVYRNCPQGMHVDHIVPILGKQVCGLHVDWNLQYLSPLENIKKGNRHGSD